MKKMTQHIKFYLLVLIALSGCVEEIDVIQDLDFEDLIVIEATITDEVKHHEIRISRSFRFDEGGALPERGAQVTVSKGEAELIPFSEKEPGIYVSDQSFKAESGVDYRLNVTTSSGKNYTTLPVELPVPSKIDRVYASREVNSIGTELFSVKVDSYDATRASNYYRYEYEETYKIIAPFWVSQDFEILTNEDGLELAFPGFKPRPTDQITCYNTDISKSIIQTSTTDLDEDRVAGFAIRNITVDDPILSHRYSILVRQYVQSLEAYTYYNVLDQLSGSGNVLSQIQPGFIDSNVFSVDNRDEKVLGFFDLSSVTEVRVFFNYEDFFQGEDLPPYFVNCRATAPLIATMSGTPLKDAIQAGLIVYWQDHNPPEPNVGPFDVVPRPCGDCTVLGNPEPPDFWID